MLVPPASTRTLCSSVSPQHPSRLHFCPFDLGRLLFCYPYKHWQCSPSPSPLPTPPCPLLELSASLLWGLWGTLGSQAGQPSVPSQLNGAVWPWDARQELLSPTMRVLQPTEPAFLTCFGVLSTPMAPGRGRSALLLFFPLRDAAFRGLRHSWWHLVALVTLC